MEDIKYRLAAFAQANNLELIRQIGFGIHGLAMLADNRDQLLVSVVKVFESTEPYERERDVYLRLQEAGATSLAGCSVPQFIGASDQHLTIWITLVDRPFCLDFAAAYLDGLPRYFPPMGEEWEAEKLAQFGAEDWSKVLRVLDELESYGIWPDGRYTDEHLSLTSRL
jgi:hypothetical protein